MRVVLQQNELVATLLEEMAEAKAAMAAGDYDQAFDILEARTSPPDLLASPPPDMTLGEIRAAQQIFDIAPAELLTSDNAELITILAAGLAAVLTKPIKKIDREKLVTTLSNAGEFGLNLVINGDPAEPKK